MTHHEKEKKAFLLVTRESVLDQTNNRRERNPAQFCKCECPGDKCPLFKYLSGVVRTWSLLGLTHFNHKNGHPRS